MRSSAAAIALMAAALLTACGSTVQPGSTTGSSGAGNGLAVGGPGLTVPSAAGSAPSGNGGDVVGSGSNGSISTGATNGSGDSGSAGETTTGGTGPTGGQSSETGQGATQSNGTSQPKNGSSPSATATASTSGQPSTTPIRVGFFYVQGGNQALSSAFPGTSVSFGDGKAEATAIVNYVNTHGGINGAKLLPFFQPVSPQHADDAGLQQACEGLVEDDHPMVILSIFNASHGLVSCAQQRNVLLIDVALGAGDDALYASAPDTLFTPTQISRNLEQTLVLSLAHSEGRITSKTTVGLLSESDDPMYGRVITTTVEPLLKSWGVPYVAATLATGDDTSGLSGAVLRFKTANVKDVAFSLGSGGIPEALFMIDANTQAFHPDYLMGDSTDPNFVSGVAPRAEVQNIWGAGTMPLADVSAGTDPSSPREKLCLGIENKAANLGYRNRATSLTSTLYCDLVFSFSDVAKAAASPLTDASWVSSYRSFGSRYDPVTTFATDFTAARNDNASEYREFVYASSCACVRYTTSPKPIPGA